MNSGGAGDLPGTTYNGSASRTISYNTIGAPSTTGTNASGTWSITATGNVLLRGCTNWSGSGVIDNVVGMLAWKNYGNNHVIFDASAGTAPNGASINNTNSAAVWGSTYPTLMGWNGSQTYGVRVDCARGADTAGSATISSQVTVNSGNGSASWYPIVWHSSNTLYSSAGTACVYPAGGYICVNYFNSSDNIESSATCWVIKNGDNYHRSITNTTAASVICANASGTWNINICGNAATASNAVMIAGGGCCSTIRCGVSNIASASCSGALSGTSNTASGLFSIVAGGRNNVASSCTSFVGGGCNNQSSGCFSSVVGGLSNVITAGCYQFVGGGYLNSIVAGGGYNVVSGGQSNCIGNAVFGAGSIDSGIGAGSFNRICSGGDNYISGGFGNTMGFASGGCVNAPSYAFIGAGGNNIVNWGYNNAIVAGCNNAIDSTCSFINSAFIGGGEYNKANVNYSAIVGGTFNSICFNSSYGFIGAGTNNLIQSSPYSSIIGGSGNTIIGNSIFPTGTPNVHVIGSNIALGSAGGPSPVQDYTYVNNLCQIGGGISDCRVKNNICNVGFGLNEILKLRPVHYCFNGDVSKKFGFIAQEIQEVIPDIVKYNPIEKVGADGRRTVTGEGEPLLEFDKEAIFASYVNAIKELHAMNQALEARVSALEEVLKAK
jgi:hypothetical protein